MVKCAVAYRLSLDSLKDDIADIRCPNLICRHDGLRKEVVKFGFCGLIHDEG